MTSPEQGGSLVPPDQGLSVTWFQDMIPDLESRAQAFRTSLDEVDEELLGLFAKQLRLIINVLRIAIAAHDIDSIRAQAHSLQGMGGTAGSPEISVVGEELSRYARQGDLGRCADLTSRLDHWQKTWAPPLPGQDALPPSGTARLEGRILVVDDALPNRLFLRKLLAARGAEVIEADTGEQALELARKTDPDVALVDVVMPGLSGYEVCQRLAEDPATRHIPVIMVTARSTLEDVEHAFAKGAFDYIRKPFHARELLVRVRNALQLKRQNDELRQWQSRMAHELEVAGSLQRKLLTTDPFFSRTMEIRSAYQSSMSVGGDVFDIIKLSGDRVCVYVGDVAGHGVGPAMISTLLKALVSEVVREYVDRGPAAMCSEIHRRFRYYVTNPELYATLFMAVFDVAARECVAFNCGHPMPLMVEASGHVLPSFPDRGGLPIGLPSEQDLPPYTTADEVRMVLPAGASLFIFTDGLMEARQADDGDPCGAVNLGVVLGAVSGNPEIVDPAREILDRLAHQGYQLSQDDCTLLVVRTVDPPSVRLERAIAPTHAEVAALASEVKRVLIEQQWPEEAAGAAQLLVMEHGANVVDHAEAPRDSRIDLKLRLTEHGAWLLFRDHGREWDFEERLAFSMRQTEKADRGRGLRIIRAIAKHIDVVRRERENVILFVVARDFTFESSCRDEGAEGS